MIRKTISTENTTGTIVITCRIWDKQLITLCFHVVNREISLIKTDETKILLLHCDMTP